MVQHGLRTRRTEDLVGGIAEGSSPSCWRRLEAIGPLHGEAARACERAPGQLARKLGLWWVLLRAGSSDPSFARTARVAAPIFVAHANMCMARALGTHCPRLRAVGGAVAREAAPRSGRVYPSPWDDTFKWAAVRSLF